MKNVKSDKVVILSKRNDVNGETIAQRYRKNSRIKDNGVENYHRVLYNHDSHESSDGEFIPDVKDVISAPLPKKGRNKKHEASSDETLSDHEENTANTSQKGTIPIDEVLCYTNSSNNNSYLVRYLDGSCIRSQILSEKELLSDKDGSKLLKNFKSDIKKGICVSNIAPFLKESVIAQVDYNCFFVDRIITHKSENNIALFDSKILTKNKFYPSLPLDTLPPIEHTKKYINCYGANADFFSSFIDSDGNFNIIGETNDSTSDYFVGGEDSAFFLVKWKGMKESDATWEQISSINGRIGSPFCAANKKEFDIIRMKYWKRTLKDTNKDVSKFQDISEPSGLLHCIVLTEAQIGIFKHISKCIVEQASAVVLTSDRTGRIIPVVAYLEVSRKKFNRNKPILVISNDSSIPSWINTIRLISTMYWITFDDEKLSRTIVMEKEFEKGQFDILVINVDTFNELYSSVLSKVLWDVIVYDQKNEVFGLKSAFKGSHNIVLFDYSNKEIVTPFKKVLFHTSNSPVFIPENIITLPFLSNSVLKQHILQIIESNSKSQQLTKQWKSLLAEIVLMYIHPFLLPSFYKKTTDNEKKNLKKHNLSEQEHNELIGAESSKIQKLIELISHNEKTVIVADGFAILRIIRCYLEQYGFSTVFLNSPMPSEEFDHFHDWDVLLMTRDYFSPDLDNVCVSQIIFFDTGQNYIIDCNIKELFASRGPVRVVRLLHKSSSEIAMHFYNCYHGLFDVFELSDSDSEFFVRLTYMLIIEGRDNSMTNIISLSKYGQIRHLYNEHYLFPFQSIGPIPGFWESILNNSESSNDLCHINKSLESIMKCFDDIITGDSFLKSMESKDSDSIVYASAIAHCLMLDSDPIKNGKIILFYVVKHILGMSNDDSEKTFRIPIEYKNWMIDSKAKEIFRDLIDKAHSAIIDHLYSIIDSKGVPSRYCGGGKDCLFISKSYDVYCAIAHRDSRIPKLYYDSLMDPNVIKPFWTPDEVNRLLKVLGEFGCPFKSIIHQYDYHELMGLACLFQKTPNMIMEFSTMIISKSSTVSFGEPLVLPSEYTKSSEIMISSETSGLAIASIKAMHIARMITLKPSNYVFKKNSEIPESWTFFQDLELCKMACKYGASQIGQSFFQIMAPQNNDILLSPQIIQPFLSFLQTKSAIRRLSFLIMANSHLMKKNIEDCLHTVRNNRSQNPLSHSQSSPSVQTKTIKAKKIIVLQ